MRLQTNSEAKRDLFAERRSDRAGEKSYPPDMAASRAASATTRWAGIDKNPLFFLCFPLRRALEKKAEKEETIYLSIQYFYEREECLWQLPAKRKKLSPPSLR